MSLQKTAAEMHSVSGRLRQPACSAQGERHACFLQLGHVAEFREHQGRPHQPMTIRLGADHRVKPLYSWPYQGLVIY